MAKVMPNPKQQYFDGNGNPLVGGKVYTYAAGTNTQKATYSNAAGSVMNANPIILDARGEAIIFWDGAYKVVVKDADDNLIYTLDNFAEGDSGAATSTLTQSYIATDGQTVFNTAYSYPLASNAVQVVINGLELALTEDFTETSTTSITLVSGLDEGDEVTLIYGHRTTTSAWPAASIVYALESGDPQRTAQDKFAEIVNVHDKGAVGDGVTDDTAAFQAAIDYLEGTGASVLTLHLDAKPYRIAGTLSVSGPVKIIGEGVYDLENSRGITRPPKGTWLIHASTTGALIEYKSNLGKGAGLIGVGIFQEGHATPGSGWTPSVREWTIINQNTQGTLILDRVHFHNVYRGVLTDNAARPQYENITGQFFLRGFEFDRIYDIGKLDGLHAWTYWSEDDNVLQWTQANGAAVVLKRVDGLWMDRIFTFALNIGIFVLDSTYGGTARVITVNGLYCDFTARALVVDGPSPAHLFISNLFHLGQAWPASPAAAIAGARGIDITAGSNHLIQVGNYYSNVCPGESIRVAGTNNQVWIGSEIIEQYDYAGSGVGAHVVAATNTVFLAASPQLAKFGGAAGDVITGAPAGAVRMQTEQQFLGGSITNRVVTAASAAGQLAVATVEGETNAGIALLASGTGTVSVGAAANKLGFYGGGAVTKQTGVAVTAAGIHAALVALNLIAP
jgi:hypothetical protein